MKTKFITSVMAIMITCASLFAADPAATVELINQEGSSIYKVVYKSPGAGKAFLKISDKEGVVFYKTLNYTNGFAYPIDFKGMADGEYTVEVVGRGAKFKKTLALGKIKPIAYVRVTEQPNNKHLLTITSQASSDFTIRVYDSRNNELLTQRESVKTEYAVILNMASVGSGFKIEVTESTGDVTVIRK